jgi:hypothetical protein
MKSTTTNKRGHNTPEPARSRAGNPSGSNSHTGYLGELAAAINSSPGVLAQRKLAQEIQESPRMGGLQQFASEINGGGIAAAPSVAAQASAAPIQRQEDGLPAERATSENKPALGTEPNHAPVAQRVIEAYDRNDSRVTRKVPVDEALDYLTDEGGQLTAGQQQWRDEVFARFRSKSKIEEAVEELAASGAVVDFEDGQPNSAAVVILSALENAPAPEPKRGFLAPSEKKPEGKAVKKEEPKKPIGKAKKKFTKFDVLDQTDEYARLPARGLISPANIKFSQDTAGFRYKDSFQLGGKIETVEQHAAAMKVHGGAGTPAIEIVLYKQRIMTLNNRRLKAHQLAGVAIPYFKSTDYTDEAAIVKHPNVDDAAPRNGLTLR